MLSEVITQPDGDAAKKLGGFRSAVEELTDRYYSWAGILVFLHVKTESICFRIIPHVFGRDRPTIIDDATLLKRVHNLVYYWCWSPILMFFIRSSTSSTLLKIWYFHSHYFHDNSLWLLVPTDPARKLPRNSWPQSPKTRMANCSTPLIRICVPCNSPLWTRSHRALMNSRHLRRTLEIPMGQPTGISGCSSCMLSASKGVYSMFTY